MQEISYLDDEKFDLWNDEKKLLNKKKRFVHPQMKEIWYIKIGINVGREIYGKLGFFRPVLVISKIGNMFFCMPMTTKGKYSEYYIKLTHLFHKKVSYIVVNQARTFDAQRFFTKIGKISGEEFEQIKKLLRYRYFPEVLRSFPLE